MLEAISTVQLHAAVASVTNQLITIYSTITSSLIYFLSVKRSELDKK